MLDFLRTSQRPAIWRQGDVFIIAVNNLPQLGRVERRPVLAEGEVTGHTHSLEDPAAGQVFAVRGELYLDVVADSATIVHEEHSPVTVPRGGYSVRIQREYSPKEIRQVVD
jgi:hypothetical protein